MKILDEKDSPYNLYRIYGKVRVYQSSRVFIEPSQPNDSYELGITVKSNPKFPNVDLFFLYTGAKESCVFCSK